MKRVPLIVTLVACCTVSVPVSHADTIEKFAGLTTDIANKWIWSYELHDLLTKHLYMEGSPIYQDLEIVFDVCHGGGMIDYIMDKGLAGNWSASTSVPIDEASEFKTSDHPTNHGKWKHPGLEIKIKLDDGSVVSRYVNGYTEQYIRAFIEDPTRKVKDLHDKAVERNFKNKKKVREPGQYASGGTGDDFTMTGNAATVSRHAIVYHGGTKNGFKQGVLEKLIATLRGAPFSYNSVDTLFSDGTPPAVPPPGVDNSDWTRANKEELTKALEKLRERLLANEGKEKALLFVEGHGGTVEEKRVSRTKDGDPPVPGEGFTFDSTHDTITIPLSVAEQARLQEEVPDGSGGFLRNKSSLHRSLAPVLNLTTYAESVTGPVSVYLADVLAGSFALNGTRGDYLMDLSPLVLAQLPWSDTSEIHLDVRFEFSSALDSFQISTSYDYFQDATFSNEFNHYGLGIASSLDQGTVPEPGQAGLLVAGVLAVLLCRRGARGRRLPAHESLGTYSDPFRRAAR
jgi:hypothetical protein